MPERRGEGGPGEATVWHQLLKVPPVRQDLGRRSSLRNDGLL